MTDNAAQPEQVSDSLLDAPEAQPAPDIDFSSGRPEGFPDEFWDAEKNTIKAEHLYKRYSEEAKRAQGLREKLSKGVQNAPKDPSEYEVKLSDELAKLVPSDDPLLQAARPIAHKYGLSKEAFSGFVSEMAEQMAQLKNKAGEQAQLTPEQEKEQIEAARAEAIQKLGPNGSQVLQAVTSWGKQLLDEGMFTEADHLAYKSMAYNADTVRVLNIMRSMLGRGEDIPSQPASDGRSRAELENALVAAFASGNEAEYQKIEQQIARLRA